MSNIYIQEPPTKGKVSEQENFYFILFEIVLFDCVIRIIGYTKFCLKLN